MKRVLVWLFSEAMSAQVGTARYVPDWDAIAAIASVITAGIGLAAIWYSIKSLRRQLRHQSELEAKQLEEALLLKVMDNADMTYEAGKQAVFDLLVWRQSNGPVQNPAFLAEVSRHASEAHHVFATATANALAVLRRSRRRRFPKVADMALESYNALIQKALAANGAVLEYFTGDWTKFSLLGFEQAVGRNAFELSNLLRRVTGELLARMYSTEPEWAAFRFTKVKSGGEAISGGFVFADENDQAEDAADEEQT